MKRKSNLYKKIYDINNLKLAETKSKRGKAKQSGVINFGKNSEDNIINLYHILKNKDYQTSEYKIFKIYEGKERIIYQLPYYPDRIVHHAIMNILEPIFVSSFISNSYSCIKGRGIHKCLKDVNKSLKDIENTKYCLKIDIKKFYPNIDHDVLKSLLRRKFKDEELLYLLDEIIDSANGVPIGNYLSQFFANFYLNYFDHWIKEELQIKDYFRYCDDIAIFYNSKEFLHSLLIKIIEYLKINLKLELKSNYQIFLVSSRGVNMVGYKSYHNKILLRPSIKKRFIKMIKYNNNKKSISSYRGWLLHGNCRNLENKYLKNGK